MGNEGREKKNVVGCFFLQLEGKKDRYFGFFCGWGGGGGGGGWGGGGEGGLGL